MSELNVGPVAAGSSRAPLRVIERMRARAIRAVFAEKAIDAIFAELDQCQLPGAAVGIALQGTPVYRKGFGLASMELPVVLSPSTRMRIYSATKQFTCLAYLLLCEEGRADIDDPICKHLPELGAMARHVTVRQLMGHTSGVRDINDITYQFNGTGHRISSAEMFGFCGQVVDRNFEPGTRWCYCNGGFLLLTIAIERIAERTLEEVLRERIFVPTGMHDTLLRRFDTDFVPNSATMHMTTARGGYEKSYLGMACPGEGGVVSTVDDMLRWLAHMSSPWIGSAGTWELMMASQQLLNGTSTGYGLGLALGNYGRAETIYHAGGGLGASSQMLKVPAAGLDIAIMVNRHDVDASALADEILGVLLPGQSSRTPSSSTSCASGTYRSPTSGRVLQLSHQNGRQFVSLGGNDLPFECNEAGIWHPAGTASYLKIALTLQGDPTRPAIVGMSEYGNRDELHRVPDSSVPLEEQVVGSYRSPGIGVEATIRHIGSRLSLRTVGRHGAVEYELECIGVRIWRARLDANRPWMGGMLAFDEEARRFWYSNLANRCLPFERCA